jgi:hypothetical protein
VQQLAIGSEVLTAVTEEYQSGQRGRGSQNDIRLNSFILEFHLVQ